MNEMMLKGYVKMQVATFCLLGKIHRDERGAGTAEYAMIIGLAVVLGVVILRAFWGQISTVFASIGRSLTSAVSNKEITD